MHFNNDTAVVRGRAATIAVAVEANLGCTRADLRRVYGAPDQVVTVDGIPFAVWKPPPHGLRAPT